jgi:hypothetical protein
VPRRYSNRDLQDSFCSHDQPQSERFKISKTHRMTHAERSDRKIAIKTSSNDSQIDHDKVDTEAFVVLE